MELIYYGAGCVLISTKQLNLLIDPLLESEPRSRRPAEKSGIKLPKVKADVALLTTLQPNKESTKDSFTFASPGEYEIKGVTIQGIAAQLHVDKKDEPFKGVMYVVGANDVRVLVTGNVAPELSDHQVDAAGDVNVVIVPVGGKGLTLDAAGAAGIISRFEPQYVVPVHYDDGKTKYDMPQDDLKPFLKEVGAEDAKPEPKLKISAKELGEDTKIVVLERQ